MKRDYETRHGGTGLAWDKAKHAAKDAWDRVEAALPGEQGDLQAGVTNDERVVQLHEERLVADKRCEKVGEVVVGKHAETETARVSVPIEKERVVVEHVSPSEAGAPVSPDRVQFGSDDVARVEVYEETPDIQKQAFVAEEVQVKKVVEREMVDVEDQIRREEIDVDTSGRAVVNRHDSGLSDR
ncbi:MAG: DUF2382 domain-containing protein [Oscillatoriales cyanobacterium C42_A2020_001]|nr:DUF2382 domain-containing protein [Leptolyngbyaceae cyanobacterium C42_A2020_001]